MAKKRLAGSIEAYSVFIVAMVAVVGLVSLYLPNARRASTYRPSGLWSR